MEDTPNFGFNRPDKGSTDWHIPLNENSSKVDGSLPIVDTYANRTSYSPADGQPYLAHDTGQWLRYEGNSGAWIEVELAGNRAKSDIGTDTRADAIVYRTGWQSGDYVGLVFRDGTTFSDSSDAGTVLQSVTEHLENNFNNNSKGGAGQILVPRNTYTFETQATITATGTKLIGGSEYQQGKRYTGPMCFDGGVPDGEGLIKFDGAEGGAVYGFSFGLGSDSGSYGLEIVNADNMMLYGLNNTGTLGSDGRALYVSGSYNSIMDNCYLFQTTMDTDPNYNKNINQWRIFRCDFRTANPDTSPLELSEGGNYMQSCIVNTDIEGGDMNAGVPGITDAPNAPFRRWKFYNCLNIGGGGDPVFDTGGGGNEFINCLLGGGRGPLFTSLRRNRVVNCRVSPNYEFIKATSDRSLERAHIVGNRIGNANSRGGTAAIDIDTASTLNKYTVIKNNLFYKGNGNYDIRFGGKDPFGTGEITNNYIDLGISQENWSPSIRTEKAPKIVDNIGYNPVRTTRTTPDLPNETDMPVFNGYAQPVTVYMWGGSKPYNPSLKDHTGNLIDLGGSPSQVEVPRFGDIIFRSNVPRSWTWYWH